MVTFGRFVIAVSTTAVLCSAGCGAVVGTGGTPVPTAGAAPGQAGCARATNQFSGLQADDAHAAYDQIVFYFTGAVPAYRAGYVATVPAGQGGLAALPGQAFLRVVFRGAGAQCQAAASPRSPRPGTAAPFFSTLLVAGPVSDTDVDLTYGIGLAGRGGYRAYAGPSELVIDFSRVTLPRFPGIWDITSWPRYWKAQYAWQSGHQAWQSDPQKVVQAWAASGRWRPLPAIEQAGAGTFTLTAPGTGTALGTVAGTRPVTTPGPWVITAVSYAAAGASPPA